MLAVYGDNKVNIVKLIPGFEEDNLLTYETASYMFDKILSIQLVSED